MTSEQSQLGFDLGVADAHSEPGLDLTALRAASEPKGVVYTRRWVVDLILDLAGYRSSFDLAARYAVEPSAGEGAFLLPMIQRLLDSIKKFGRSFDDARGVLRAYELDESSASLVVGLATDELRRRGVDPRTARETARGWVTVGDYLLSSPRDRKADLVVGNPPYIRYDDLPQHAFDGYRRLYPTMVGRCDIYVGFIEAGVRQLTEGGALAFICADRWMRAAYGAQLRHLISSLFSTEVVIEMHDAPAFESDVAAYPAVIVIRRANQGSAIVASAGKGVGSLPGGGNLADAVIDLAGKGRRCVPGFTATRVDRWFVGTTPWPSLEPRQLEILQRLEGRFRPLEDVTTGTRVGLGVATGADAVYVTKDSSIVEPDRLLPLAMAADTKTGSLHWSGHYLVDPWEPARGLINLDSYPLVRAYFESHRAALLRRNVAQRNARDWYRTIDRVNHQLTQQKSSTSQI